MTGGPFHGTCHQWQFLIQWQIQWHSWFWLAMKHCFHSKSQWMTSCHWWQVLWNGLLINHILISPLDCSVRINHETRGIYTGIGKLTFFSHSGFSLEVASQQPLNSAQNLNKKNPSPKCVFMPLHQRCRRHYVSGLSVRPDFFVYAITQVLLNGISSNLVQGSTTRSRWTD